MLERTFQLQPRYQLGPNGERAMCSERNEHAQYPQRGARSEFCWTLVGKLFAGATSNHATAPELPSFSPTTRQIMSQAVAQELRSLMCLGEACPHHP